MSYAKAMKHHRNPRKWKMTASRIRGNALVFGKSPVINPETLARKLNGK